MIDLRRIADESDIILSGYAFTRDEAVMKVLNLNDPRKSAVFSGDEILATTMDDAELSFITKKYRENKKYIEL